MSGNVVTHGFSDTGKKHAVDIRVVYKDNELTLRIRDNCKSFDPSEHAKSKDSEDVGNIGIRLVYSIAKEVSYQNLLGMNMLTIKM